VLVILVESVLCTCEACPSQWEGLTADAQVVYARYRYARLTIGVGATLEEAVANSMDGDLGFARDFNRHDYDGELSFEELKTATVGIVSWPIEENVRKNATRPPSD
jgi:hypothetical protein